MGCLKIEFWGHPFFCHYREKTVRPVHNSLIAVADVCVTLILAEDAQSNTMQILIDKVKRDRKLLIDAYIDSTDQKFKEVCTCVKAIKKGWDS
jgi:hypothetical protein